jgi:hypothetical protein
LKWLGNNEIRYVTSYKGLAIGICLLDLLLHCLEPPGLVLALPSSPERHDRAQRGVAVVGKIDTIFGAWNIDPGDRGSVRFLKIANMRGWRRVDLLEVARMMLVGPNVETKGILDADDHRSISWWTLDAEELVVLRLEMPATVMSLESPL